MSMGIMAIVEKNVPLKNNPFKSTYLCRNNCDQTPPSCPALIFQVTLTNTLQFKKKKRSRLLLKSCGGEKLIVSTHFRNLQLTGHQSALTAAAPLSVCPSCLQNATALSRGLPENRVHPPPNFPVNNPRFTWS